MCRDFASGWPGREKLFGVKVHIGLPLYLKKMEHSKCILYQRRSRPIRFK